MNKTILIAFLLGIYTLTTAQDQSQDEEIMNLKKQVSILRGKNARLEKNTWL